MTNLLSLSSNSRCCDCNDLRPTWATLVLPPVGVSRESPVIGAFCCLHCSAAHRRLGSHICHVRSVTLDDWSEDDVQAMIKGGNLRVNSIFEGSMFNDTVKPTPLVDASVRHAFIRDKYDNLKFFVPNAYNCIGTEDEDEDEDIIDDDDETVMVSVLPLQQQTAAAAAAAAASAAASCLSGGDSSSLTSNMKRINRRGSVGTATSRRGSMKRQASMPTIKSPRAFVYQDDPTEILSKSCSTEMDFWESMMSSSDWGDLTFEPSLHNKLTLGLATKSGADSEHLSPQDHNETTTGAAQGDRGADHDMTPPAEKRKENRNDMNRPKSERYVRAKASSSRLRSNSSKERRRNKKYGSSQALLPEKKEKPTAIEVLQPGLMGKLRSNCAVPVSNEAEIFHKLEMENMSRLVKEREGQPSSSKAKPRRHRSEQELRKTPSRRELLRSSSRGSSSDKRSNPSRYHSDCKREEEGILFSTGMKDVKSPSMSPGVRQRKSRSSSTSGTHRVSGGSPNGSRRSNIAADVAPPPSYSTLKSQISPPSNPTRRSRTERSPMRPRKPSSLQSLQESPREKNIVPTDNLSHQPRASSCDTAKSRRRRSCVGSSMHDTSDPEKLHMKQQRISSPRFRNSSRRSNSPATSFLRTVSSRSINANSRTLPDSKASSGRSKTSQSQLSAATETTRFSQKIFNRPRSLDPISRRNMRRSGVRYGLDYSSAHTLQDSILLKDVSASSMLGRSSIAQPASKARSLEARASRDAFHASFADSLSFSTSHQATLIG